MDLDYVHFRDEQLNIVQAKIAGPLALTWHRRYKQYANC